MKKRGLSILALIIVFILTGTVATGQVPISKAVTYEPSIVQPRHYCQRLDPPEIHYTELQIAEGVRCTLYSLDTRPDFPGPPPDIETICKVGADPKNIFDHSQAIEWEGPFPPYEEIFNGDIIPLDAPAELTDPVFGITLFVCSNEQYDVVGPFTANMEIPCGYCLEEPEEPYDACINNYTGRIRVVSDPSRCRRFEKAIRFKAIDMEE
jgi:hypothetical protein